MPRKTGGSSDRPGHTEQRRSRHLRFIPHPCEAISMGGSHPHNYPKLHNAAWPGVVGKGGEGGEPYIDLATMLDLTAAAQVDGIKFDGFDVFLFIHHINIDATDDEIKALAELATSRGWSSIHVTDSDMPYMRNWWVPGLQIGYEHTFVHQVADFLENLARAQPTAPTFRDALATQAVCDAVLASADHHKWETVVPV